MGCDCDRARILDLLRVGVDRRRLLADRKLDAGAVEDRAPSRRNLLRLLMLGVREPREVCGLNALE